MSSKFSPDHYTQGEIEPWDFITSQDLGFLEGNVVKYITRAGKKDGESRLDDLLKASAYIHKLIRNECNTIAPRPDGSSSDVPEDHGSTSGSVYPYNLGDSIPPRY